MEEDWTSKPNLVGDKKTVEELISSGDVGRDLAAFGCVASALNAAREAELRPGEPKFLYPTSRMFPFDEATYEIVKKLEERNFKVPGINVKLDSYGPSNAYTKVDTIQGDDFRLWFCRIQGSLSPFNDIAAVSEINIPGKELHVYNDHSGPRMFVMTGKQTKARQKAFMHANKVGSKLYGKPKTYLEYEGAWEDIYIRPGKLAPLLKHTNDCGREYEPGPHEKKCYLTKEIFEEFKGFLENKVTQI